MTPKEKKDAENERLEYSMDSFPLNAESKSTGAFFRYTKYEFPDRNRMNFYKNPEFVVEDLFYDVLNGKVPEQDQSKFKYPNPK